MGSRWSPPRWRWVLLALAVLAAAAVASAQSPAADANDPEARRLLAAVTPIAAFELGEGPQAGYAFTLRDPDGHVRGRLSVVPHEQTSEVPRVRTQHYAVTIASYVPDPAVTATLVRAAHAVVDADGGALPERPVRLNTQPRDGFVFAAGILAALALAAARWRKWNIQVDFRAVHVVQMLTQGSIFLYWSLYWPGVRGQIALLGLMLVMGFASDALFSFLRFGSWRAGFSVVPVVFSINLFEWFDARGAVLSVVAAFACKHLVHRRGRHIFNPSVAGLTVTGIVTLVAPDFVHFGGLFHTLNVPPNMAEWILLVTLLPQLRFRILPVSIGTLAALTFWDIPGVLRPTIVIAMTLLATDPATTPSSDLGKFLFGLVFGGLLPEISIVLRGAGHPDDFAKIFAIPVANLLVPQLDAVGKFVEARLVTARDAVRGRLVRKAGSAADAMERWGARLSGPIPNVVYVAMWLAYVVPRLAMEKPLYFEPEIHWNYGTPHVVRGADDVPHCAENPAFCRSFSFRLEIDLWRHARP